ncbi:hypothetical protein HOY34_02745 [Xinfangfangia sp. D13-10-4-6]|uniref:hypothetical protein n=1 Tax=Pseudogemmobacter hezensis TaxID=2737662 RepID=UPI0015536BDF|nr:hypothetical protein [Pseudogemmobacter hezensis]NPD14115.1 hypothetical protein [Pseudogemmobacter hezensis]
MSDITVKALYASVVEDEGLLFIGFVEGEDEDEPYVMFRRDVAGGPVWFEVSDESLGAEDAVESVTQTERGLSILIDPAKALKIGAAREITVRITPATENGEEATEALRDMLGPRFL